MSRRANPADEPITGGEAAARVLVLGGSGMLGRQLLQAFAAARPGLGLAGTALTDTMSLPVVGAAHRLDVHAPAQLADILGGLRPDTVVLTVCPRAAASATRELPGLPDWDRELAARQVKLVRRLSAWLEKTGGQLILCSSVSVFCGRSDGDAPAAWRESDAVAPASVAGEAFVGMEQVTRESGVRHLILRMPVELVGWRPGRATPFSRLVDALRRGHAVAGRDGHRTNPASAPLVADAIALLWAAGQEGVWHCGGSEVVSELRFRRAIARALGFSEDAVTPIDGATATARALDVTRLQRKLADLGAPPLPSLAGDLQVLLTEAPGS